MIKSQKWRICSNLNIESLGLEPKSFRCSIPFCDDEASTFNDANISRYFQDPDRPNYCEKPIFSMENVSNSSLSCDNLPIVGYEKCHSSDDIIYEPFEYDSTFVTEMNLVCEDQFKVSLVGTGKNIGSNSISN